jgi:hypothetical protein
MVKMPAQNLKLSPHNPSPFKQPFLALSLTGEGAVAASGRNFPEWLVDVDGKIDLYITPENEATPLLEELCASLAHAGIRVRGFSTYEGSGGPSLMLRHGALFERMTSIENAELGEDSLAYFKPGYRRQKRPE